jgi:hypothetical protein
VLAAQRVHVSLPASRRTPEKGIMARGERKGSETRRRKHLDDSRALLAMRECRAYDLVVVVLFVNPTFWR